MTRKKKPRFLLDANLFVKNLPQNIDEKILKDLFSMCGTVLSVKIAKHPNGDSKGHGFVQFENEDSANRAISELHGAVIHGRKILVSKFIPSHERSYDEKFSNNVFVKNVTSPFSGSDFEEMCQRFGNVKSAKLVMNKGNLSKGYGFVSFETPEAAERAIAELNIMCLNGKRLFASIAQRRIPNLRPRRR